MEFEICNLETDNVIYFSEDGLHFSSTNSQQLYPFRVNVIDTQPHHYFLLGSDLLDGREPVGDGEITAAESDWHEQVIVDGQVFFAPAPKMYRQVIHCLRKTGEEDQ